MMPYKLIEKNNTFSVEETKSPANERLVIYNGILKEDARKVYRNMKRGGAFNGWTPNFFVPSKELVKIV